MIWLRSLLFNIAFWGTTIGVGLFCLPLMLAPRRWLVPSMRLHARAVVGLLRVLCGVRLRVEGAEHLPRSGPGLVAAKHQSAFDTMIWFALLPDVAYVLKRELLFLPIWGWYCWKGGHLAVDRRAGASALRHLVKAGKAAVADGRQIVIFPEGTRVAPGQKGVVQPGVAALAAATGLPVVPVATDSGVVWGRRAFVKRPGVITVAVRPPIPPGQPRAALLRRIEAGIELAEPGDSPAQPVDKPVDSAYGAVPP